MFLVHSNLFEDEFFLGCLSSKQICDYRFTKLGILLGLVRSEFFNESKLVILVHFALYPWAPVILLLLTIHSNFQIFWLRFIRTKYKRNQLFCLDQGSDGTARASCPPYQGEPERLWWGCHEPSENNVGFQKIQSMHLGLMIMFSLLLFSIWCSFLTSESNEYSCDCVSSIFPVCVHLHTMSSPAHLRFYHPVCQWVLVCSFR